MLPKTDLPLPDDIKDKEIIRVLVGSTLYGTGLEGREDTDLMGVCVPPWRSIYGLGSFDQFMWRTQPEGARSGPGDIDYTCFGLQKYMRLACKGNPTILLLLFVPEAYCEVLTPLGRFLQEQKKLIISKDAGMRYLRYSQRQRRNLEEKMYGKSNRPELIEEFGYDTKYAMHALRLLYHGIEVMTNGEIELPIGKHRDLLRAIRYGEVQYKDVLVLIAETEVALIKAIDETKLQEHPEISTIENFMRWCYEETYNREAQW
jgi:predicted nucleotidyltransferase